MVTLSARCRKSAKRRRMDGVVWTDRDGFPASGVVARKQAPSNSVWCRENDARSSSPRLRQVYVLPVQGEQALCWVRQPAPRRPASFPRHDSPVELLSLHPYLSASLGSSAAYPRSWHGSQPPTPPLRGERSRPILRILLSSLLHITTLPPSLALPFYTTLTVVYRSILFAVIRIYVIEG